MNSIKVTIGVIPFGGVKYLPYSLGSLLEQDYTNIEYLLLDQEEGQYSASKWIEKERPEWLKKINLRQGPNLWHSGGMNSLMHDMTGDIFIVASQDMLYPADFVSKIVDFFQTNPQFEFGTVRLYRWDFENLSTTNIIDSLGIQIKKSHQAFEIGQGDLSDVAEKPFEEIFGASGALFILTKKAIERVSFENQVFDENLHYKNDVDLSYRLQWAGCKGALINNVIVYHDRFIAPNSKKPFWVKKQSLFGDWVFLLKNYSWKYSFSTHLKTWFYFNTKTAYLLITNPKLFVVIKDLWLKRKNIFQWRSGLVRKISAQNMENKLL